MHDLRVRTGDIELQVREYPARRCLDTVIFLHFGGGNLMMWDGVAPFFAGDYRLALIDLRGHGRSDRPASGYHIETMAADVAGVMRSLGIASAHVVGSSLGAEVAIAMAATYPEKAISVTCDGAIASEYGPYSLWEGSETDFAEHVSGILARVAARPKRTFPTADEAAAYERQKYEKQGLWNPLFEAMISYGVVETGPGQFAFGFPEYLGEYMKHYFAYRFEEYYGRIRCPVLFLPSADDSQDPRAKAVLRGLAQRVCRTKIIEIPGWIHPYGWLLDPEGASRAVLEFLTCVKGTRGR